MQTFLPFPDFRKSMSCLDMKRLGKQRVETLQIIHQLTGIKVVDGVVIPCESYGWGNHPITRMWDGFETALILYGLINCQEWTSRGYRDGVAQQITTLFPGAHVDMNVPMPEWFGNDAFHRSHRSNLVRKMPEHYRDKLGWVTPNNLPYIWPK